MTSDLTYKIIAFTDSPGFDMDTVVDWAVEMMELGYESDNLYILAGLNKPVLYFEAVNYLQAALKDLGLNTLQGDDAYFSRVSYAITKIAKGENIRQHLHDLEDLCIHGDCYNVIQNFYLLYWAWDDLDYADGYNEYWPDANRSNIEQITIDTATKWLAANEQRCKQLLKPLV